MNKDPVLELKNVTKTYLMGNHRVKALDRINLSIYPGEFVSITGPSGSGKSTLMHIIGLLDTPTSGQVFLKKKPIENLDETQLARARNKEIGFIFQQFHLLPRTSALENVSIPLVYSDYREKERKEKSRRMLEKLGLGNRLNHHPNQLSGGQQQRVAIARALVNNPSLVLADEPTGNLDTKTGREILDVLKKIWKEGRTVVMVTHDPALAQKAQRTIKIIDGLIVKK